jgi:hypothetical protein
VRILRERDWHGWSVAEIDMSPDPQRQIREGIDYYHQQLEIV